MKKLGVLLSQKAGITAFSLLAQLALLAVGAVYAAAYLEWIWAVTEVFAIAVSLHIVSRDMDIGYKLSWCVLILAVPICGGLIYLLLGRRHTPRRLKKKLDEASDAAQVLMNITGARILAERREANPTGTGLADLVLRAGSFPVFDGTEAKYYPLGELMFPDLAADIRAAKRYVFLEYFLITPGKVWSELEAALKERAKAGVDVRIVYDDVGCLFTLPKRTVEELRESGIKILPFNRVTVAFDARLNNRTHRKIAVIDGEIAYTGGNNIADEYANIISPHGHWKDCHLRVQGRAAWGFAAMFLSVWRILDQTGIRYDDFYTDAPVDAPGYVQPLCSGPGRNDRLIERAFINLISTAKRTVYITTPYLILDSAMQNALVNAAGAGVDVRMIIPGIPDRRAVYLATRSFVPPLVRAGVRVYRYTPGFIHAKTVIADDDRAFIGTCNMDYRSFYLHYECGALLYNTDAVIAMRSDFCSTLDRCAEITFDDTERDSLPTRIAYSFMRLISPLL